MDPYDSDSSGLEDEGDYTETNVLLGYASEEPTDDTVSHVGGWPTWLDSESPPPGNFANCKVCNSPMLLLLQLNGDLPEYFPDDERRLYIFSCPRKPCTRKAGSIRALRGIKKHKPQPQGQKPKAKPESMPQEKSRPEPEKPKVDLGASLFGAAPSSNGLSGNANPFSTPASTAQSNNANPFATSSLAPTSSLSAVPPQKPAEPAAPAEQKEESLPETFADKVRVSSPAPAAAPPVAAGPPLPWPDASAFPDPYTQFHLDAEYETLSRPSTPTIPTTQTPAVEDDATGGGEDSKGTFESSLDKPFLRFSTRLGHNPEQILRYEFRGSPLLYSNTDAVGKLFSSASGDIGGGSSHIQTATSSGPRNTNRIPRCESCGRERVFEVQLVPHLISVLEDGREGIGLGASDDAGMEWGTIILGVCKSDCGPQRDGEMGWREEWVGVQWEERVK